MNSKFYVQPINVVELQIHVTSLIHKLQPSVFVYILVFSFYVINYKKINSSFLKFKAF